MVHRDDLLRQAIDRKTTPTFMKTKDEIVAHYQDRHARGEIKSWKQALVHKLAEITGMKPKNLEKRFDPQRLHNVEKRNASQYEALGKLLPPISRKPNGGSMTFLIEGRQGHRDRTMVVTLTGSAAYDVANMGSADDQWAAIWDEYGHDFFEEDDTDYELLVGSVG